MVLVYPVIYTKTGDRKDTYLVEIPDLDGATEGYGIEDAIEMAREYICSYCYDLSKKDYPKASNPEDIDLTNAKFAESGKSIISLIDADIDQYRKKMDMKTVRRNVSLPGWMNQEAEKNNINVSRVLQEALADKLGIK